MSGMPVVFVHGWSVHNTDTYGGFPERLRSEATAQGLEIDIAHIHLGKYVSFRDEVRVRDISRAFEAAVREELGGILDEGRRFACISHSTGGPVVRHWLDRYYTSGTVCPMSHLIMLAPANFGSALAQLGKGALGQAKSWFVGTEPGTGVLDWLELGSPEAWNLNFRTIAEHGDLAASPDPVYQFVLTGQCIDHAVYDHVNSYTGEIGSDGVVRAAAANLNATYLRLEQGTASSPVSAPLELKLRHDSPRTAFSLVRGMAHSGDEIGIIRSVKDDGSPHETLVKTLKCIAVDSAESYTDLCDDFKEDTAAIVEEERIEVEDRFFLPDHIRVRDPHFMAIFRVRDSEGMVPERFDLVLTAGEQDSPNHLPIVFSRSSAQQPRQGSRDLFHEPCGHDGNRPGGT